MSEAAATAAVPAAAPAPRALRGIDLYAEGNSFPESDGAAVERLFGADGIGFRDLLDIVNPLQHLPVVGTLYRAVTGDALSPGSRILGGTLFGGIGGFVTALVNAVVENETGSDFGDKALALLQSAPARPESVAAAAPARPKPIAAPAAPPAATTPEPERKPFPIFAGPPAPDAAGNTDPAEAKQAPASEPKLALAAEAADPPAPDVAHLMQSALDKYEALMKSRGDPSFSRSF